jgi:hypothetical protein
MEFCASDKDLRRIVSVKPGLEIKISVKNPGRTIGDEP